MTEQEFTTLVEELRPELVKIATRRCGRNNAENAVQTALLHCWKDGGWANETTKTVKGWLCRLTRMRARDELRSLGRLNAAQINLGVLANNGCKHIERASNSDGEETR